jgi:predicted transcriptional regulator
MNDRLAPANLRRTRKVCYHGRMNADLRTMLARAEHWPEEDQEELAQIAIEIEARRHGVYHATPDELQAIDEALAAVARGEVASDEEVEAVFAKYRRA